MKWLKLAWLFLRVAAMDLKRSYLEGRNLRLRIRFESRRRPWKAISPHGSLELGTVTHGEALKRASNLGRVSYVDLDVGVIFYDTDQGGPAPSGSQQ